MKLVLGLGNPGKKYQNNRHNVGHMFVNYLINELRITDYGFKTLKTDCFMNLSGNFVKKLVTRYTLHANDIIVVHDDLDIPLGKFKIEQGPGPKLHNGINSIEETLRTQDFWRVRIGVENRTEKISGETYVLQDFADSETEAIQQTFPKIADRLKNLLLS